MQKITDWSYALDPNALKNRIGSLAQFIDMLEMTTAIDKGISIGCRIGQMAADSIGYSLGLRYDDIITHINRMPIASTQERVVVYQSLQNMALNQTVHVTLIRKQKEHTLLFVLKNLSILESGTPRDMQSNQATVELQKLGTPLPGESVRENPTALLSTAPPAAYDIQKRDQAAMRKYGGRAGLLQRTH